MQRNYIDWPLICSPTAEQFELAEKQRAETANLDDEIVFYETTIRADLEVSQMGKWVVVHDRKLEGTFDSFGEAARNGVSRFGKGPFLLQQVGAPRTTLSIPSNWPLRP